MGVESCKIVILGGQFLFTCSDTFDVGYIVQPQCTVSQTDGQTDDIIMQLAAHTAVINSK